MQPSTDTIKRPNQGQAAAIEGILSWLADDNAPSKALLSGEAGTGKTFCMIQLASKYPKRIVFTAPTNKATKVLRTTLLEEIKSPMTKTIYSLLGLRIQPNGEVKELLEPEEDIDLGEFGLVVVDEASMVNALLMSHIDRALENFPKLRVLFVGDSAQLPPVKENASLVWKIKTKWHLDEQMRNAGPILSLAKELRKQQGLVTRRFAPQTVHHENGSVVPLSTADFTQWIKESARAGEFSGNAGAKVIAWRNVTVETFNRMIRKELFEDPSIMFQPEDRIILIEPARDFIEDVPLASTDDEGVIHAVDVTPHPLYGDIKVWRMSVTSDDNRQIVLYVLHEASQRQFFERSEHLAAAARMNKRLWGEFWAFREAFHSVRHAYAITAHRSQGSTYEKAFVNYRDILVNLNKLEAYQCLYVGATRPKRQLILG